MPSITQMIQSVHQTRNRLETQVVGAQGQKLARIFARAEVQLARQQRLFRTLDTKNGALVRSVGNVREAERILRRLAEQVKVLVVDAGQEWADDALLAFEGAGRQLARTNFNHDFLSQESIDAVFARVSRSEGTALVVGKDRLYRIMATVGDDVNEWFRAELLDSITEGIPIQGRGDTLSRRLFESGRLKPITIKTRTGRIIRRSIQQRADAIARVESAQIINDVHDALAEQAIGDDRVALNSNPQDSRTTDICARASREPPMTKRQWQNSEYGLAPRLKPFHLCRSVHIWGQRAWFEKE